MSARRLKRSNVSPRLTVCVAKFFMVLFSFVTTSLHHQTSNVGMLRIITLNSVSVTTSHPAAPNTIQMQRALNFYLPTVLQMLASSGLWISPLVGNASYIWLLVLWMPQEGMKHNKTYYDSYMLTVTPLHLRVKQKCLTMASEALFSLCSLLTHFNQGSGQTHKAPSARILERI